ncbi:ribosome maturation factor RimM [Solimonas marina]|uniref:Ribosome maturation factor RimM n=1 Tax=Solimonas marina TaxID=2714601 RepID=A0A970B8R0_9GAMM|nr:16S rRNA processing protein RimM [Solimonas marina]
MTTHRVTLGRVSGVFGVKGWIKVHSYTRPPDNILRYRQWWLTSGDGFEAKVLASQIQGQGLIAQLSDANGSPIDDRDVAAALIGAEIAVPREALPALPEGEHYWVDMVGLRVENPDGVSLGTVSDVTSNGAQDVLVVMDGDTERMIPFVTPQIVLDVDRVAGRIVCEWQPDW